MAGYNYNPYSGNNVMAQMNGACLYLDSRDERVFFYKQPNEK